MSSWLNRDPSPAARPPHATNIMSESPLPSFHGIDEWNPPPLIPFHKWREMTEKKITLSEVLFDANSGKDLLSEEFYVVCFVLRVESRQTSQVLSLLADRLPLLDFGLSHLKRVRKTERNSTYVEILVGPVSALDSIPENLWSKCGLAAPPSSEQEGKELVPPSQCPGVLTCRVPRFEPNHRQEFTVWSLAWPINFHPGEEERSRSKGHTEEELRYVSHHVNRLLEMKSNTAEGSGSSAVAILTDPQTTVAICTSQEAEVRLREQHRDGNVSHHPLLCPTLLAVDQIAAIARKEVPGFGKPHACINILYDWSH